MQKHTTLGINLSLAIFALAVQPCWADSASSLRLSTGFDYTTGSYGTSTTTTISSIPTTLTYDTGPWTFKLMVPYVRISGAGNVVAGLGAVKKNTIQSSSASGLGDVITAATYNLYNNAAAQMGVDLTGKIKFGTANSDKGLGTGKNDFTTQIDLYKTFDRWTVFGGIGYAVLGSSSTLPLNNVMNTTAGTTYHINDTNTVGMAFDYRQKVSDTSFAQRELTGFLSHKIDKDWKAQLYLLKGFSDGSPDWGGGASIAYSF